MTTDTSSVAPPDVATWYDLEATTDDVLAILRLTDADVDAERIKGLVPAAAVLIDQFLDRVDAITGPPPPPPIRQALNIQTIELYRIKDAPATPGLSPYVRPFIRPWKQRHGLA